MPQEYSPKDLQRQVKMGFDRLRNFRMARMLFLRAYTGQYYDRVSGNIGTEPLAFIFNAIRSIVPHIVMSFPKHKVNPKWVKYKDYADLLGLTLEMSDKELDIRTIYRRQAVDALFALGITKTGLAQSDSIYSMNEYDKIDNGTVYTACTDFDNFVVDPRSEEHLFVDAQWMGDRLCVPRVSLLDSGLYKNDLVEKLPSVETNSKSNGDGKASELSQRGITSDDVYGDEDYVEVVEIWVPGAKALVTVPGDCDMATDDYLRIADYYGPDDGPYSILALTPPVPGNPIPVPSVGIWYDLHILANQMASKIIDQATRQKDILAYQAKAIDDVLELQAAGDGEGIKVDDIDAIKTVSFGGQKNSNETYLNSLAGWFNMMAGNPQLASGQAADSDTATGASILQNNATIGVEDVKDLIYSAAAVEGRKRAWFFHTDPLINKPLTRRRMQSGQMVQGPMGPVLLPPSAVEEQIILTPEMRQGDFLDFAFEIVPESMGRPEPAKQLAVALDFCTKVMPGVFSAAQAALQMGMPFSPQALLVRLAEQAGIDWLDEVYFDPQFQLHMMQMMMMGPQMANSIPGGGGSGAASPAAMMQNGQPANVGASQPSPMLQQRQQQQAGAASSQQTIKQGY